MIGWFDVGSMVDWLVQCLGIGLYHSGQGSGGGAPWTFSGLDVGYFCSSVCVPLFLVLNQCICVLNVYKGSYS